MKNVWVWSFVMCSVAKICRTVLMQDMPDQEFSDSDQDFNSVFQTCLRSEPLAGEGLSGCAARGVVASLVGADGREAVPLAEGVQLIRDPSAAAALGARQVPLLPIDRDPTDIRSVLDAASAFLSRRALRWDLGTLYPGLVLKVGPSFTGSGVMEFALDRHYSFTDRTLTTGRLMFRRLLLPLLLGFKIKLVTLVPLFFLAVVVIAKKALLVSKFAMLLSGFLGLNSLFLLQSPQLQRPVGGVSPGGITILQQDDVLEPSGPSSSWFSPLSNFKAPLFAGVNYPYADEDRRQRSKQNRGNRDFAWEGEKREKAE